MGTRGSGDHSGKPKASPDPVLRMRKKRAREAEQRTVRVCPGCGERARDCVTCPR